MWKMQKWNSSFQRNRTFYKAHIQTGNKKIDPTKSRIDESCENCACCAWGGKKKDADILSQQFLFQKLSVKVLGIIVGQFSSLFNSLCHRRDTVKQIAHLYFALKLKHLCKLRNDKANTLCRHKSKKLVLFKHE